MESETTKQNYRKTYIIIGIVSILTFSGLLFDLYLTYGDKKDKDVKIDKLTVELNKELLEKTTCVYLRDSLFKANTDLSKFKTLTMAMVHREEATSQLKHKVGDLVYMKNDSAKVVIEDVLIGGGKYNYYIKFKVLYKDNTTKEVVPELIY